METKRYVKILSGDYIDNICEAVEQIGIPPKAIIRDSKGVTVNYVALTGGVSFEEATEEQYKEYVEIQKWIEDNKLKFKSIPHIIGSRFDYLKAEPLFVTPPPNMTYKEVEDVDRKLWVDLQMGKSVFPRFTLGETQKSTTKVTVTDEERFLFIKEELKFLKELGVIEIPKILIEEYTKLILAYR